jgi:hypothetical protein
MGHTRSTSSPGEAVLPPPVRWISPQRSPHIAHRKRTQEAVEWVVAEVWRQHIWAPFRPLIAARLDCVRLGAGGRIYWRHQGQQLILTVTEWTPGGEWEADMRYAVGHLMMYALLVEVAAITAGVNAQTGSLPGYRQGAPATAWYLALQRPTHSRVGNGRRITRQMAAALIHAYGLHHPKPLIDVSIPPASDADLTGVWEDDWREDEDEDEDDGEGLHSGDVDDDDLDDEDVWDDDDDFDDDDDVIDDAYGTVSGRGSTAPTPPRHDCTRPCRPGDPGHGRG